MRKMGFERSRADPCLYYNWSDDGLVVWLSWIDDCFCLGSKEAVMRSKKKLMSELDYSDEGELNEYVWCKIINNTSEKLLKFTQPVLM